MRGALLWGVLVTGVPASLSAQQVSALLGGVSARYADSVSGSAALVGGRVRYSRGGVRSDLETSVARFTSGEWAAQLGAQGLFAAALTRRDAVGLGVGGSFNQLEGGIWSMTAAAGPFVARSTGGVTASLSLTGGWVRTVDSTSFATGTATLGGRYERGRWRLEGVAAGTAADTLRLLDWSLSAGWRGSAISVGVLGGVRTGDLASDPWWQLRAEAGVASWAGLEAAVGWYPRDLTGFTAGRFATLAMRLDVLRGTPTPTLRGAGAFRAERLGAARVRVTLRLDGARTVALAGEWNEWVPAPMRRDPSGRWTAVLGLRPGVYRCALLVDGARWIAPPGAPKTGDDFGGEVGLLIVPEA
ncbi:MAG: hypothetical protein HYY94_01975 [Gemmatimonadetes bacterium]|nr:hypothetical protein [Gemmatimonadota bacterium]